MIGCFLFTIFYKTNPHHSLKPWWVILIALSTTYHLYTEDGCYAQASYKVCEGISQKKITTKIIIYFFVLYLIILYMSTFLSICFRYIMHNI